MHPLKQILTGRQDSTSALFGVCCVRVSAVDILLPQGCQEPKPDTSAASAASALSGVDVDVSFPRRLRVSAVNDVFYPSAPQNTEASKRPTIVIHPLNSLTGTEV